MCSGARVGEWGMHSAVRRWYMYVYVCSHVTIAFGQAYHMWPCAVGCRRMAYVRNEYAVM